MKPHEIIEPRILKGFRDFLPDAEIERKRILAKLEAVMTSFGFTPIDTPILEYTEILLGKAGGETEKQMYHFKDAGDRDVAMRFDLTVPFARFMAQHRNELYVPFKRFHFAKVFRGENAQKGRYREFMQCDFDMVGVDSLASDIEILLVMYESFKTLGIAGIEFCVSHRGLFNQFLTHNGIVEHSVEILRRVDKLNKIGEAETLKLLTELISESQAGLVLQFIKSKTIVEVEKLSGGPSDHSKRLSSIFAHLTQLGLGGQFKFDPSITRGLDYYTGIVYETFLTDLPSLGSVCSGGRYNDLASLYTKEELPGVGSSIGLDRLIAGLEDLGLLNKEPPSAHVLVALFDEALLPQYHKTASELRNQGFNVEVFPAAKKLPQQFAYAEKKHIPFIIIMGENEAKAGVLNLRYSLDRSQLEQIPLDQAIAHLREHFAKR